MASIQDLETRVRTLEDRVKFVMELIRISQTSPLAGVPPRVVSMNDLYLTSKGAGLEISGAENG